MTSLRDVRVDVLCPIDLDFEPDVLRLAAEDQTVVKVQPGPGGAPAVEVPRVSLGHVALDGVVLAPEAKLAARVYRFGTGVVRISFVKEDWDLAGLAPISARTEQITIDGKTVVEIARAIGDELREKLRPYAVAHYDVRLTTTEAYPVIRVGSFEGTVARGDAFVAAEQRAITAITGLPGRDPARLSAFALETARIQNLACFEDEVVVVREAGAFLHISEKARGSREAVVDEARKVSGLIELAYAQYWSIRSVDELAQKLQTDAYAVIARLQEEGAFALSPQKEILAKLYRAREEHMATVALIDDFLELPAIGYDVYLDAVFREVQRVFGAIERARTASDRLEDLEKSFEVVHHILAERRLLVIEVLVLLVIVVEFLFAIFGKH